MYPFSTRNSMATTSSAETIWRIYFSSLQKELKFINPVYVPFPITVPGPVNITVLWSCICVSVYEFVPGLCYGFCYYFCSCAKTCCFLFNFLMYWSCTCSCSWFCSECRSCMTIFCCSWSWSCSYFLYCSRNCSWTMLFMFWSCFRFLSPVSVSCGLPNNYVL